MRFGSTAKVLAKCMLKYYRISECVAVVSGERSRSGGVVPHQSGAVQGASPGAHTARHAHDRIWQDPQDSPED